MRIVVLGRTVDDQTRCIHYSGPTDVIAIKFKCCGSYYPCFECHRECTDHPARQWPADEWDEVAIMCGVCRVEQSIRSYLGVQSCENCGADFNERCRLHRHLYFAQSTPAQSGRSDADHQSRSAGLGVSPPT
jgi:uncharacterized CHY-type Zn-finger protein